MPARKATKKATQRQRGGTKGKGTRRKITPELLAAIAKLGTPELVAKRYGYAVPYAAQLLRKAQGGAPVRDYSTTVAARVTGMKQSKAIGAYLVEVREGGSTGAMNLGALSGFPAKTADPDVADRAVAFYEATILPRERAKSALSELKARQRLMTMKRQAAAMRAGTNGHSAEAGFIANAADWAAANGVSYAAFREMGVTPAVLKQAGVKP
jgi:hypothetical protein